MKKISAIFFCLLLMAVFISCNRKNDDPEPEQPVAFTQGDVIYSDTDGDIYLLHDPEGSATITKIHENANKIVEDILIDQSKKQLYLANYTDGKIYVADFKGTEAINPVEFVSVQAKALALWDKDGKRLIYAASNDFGQLKEIDLKTKAVTEPNFGQGPATVVGVAVDNVNGKIYINQDDEGIKKLPDNMLIINNDLNEGKLDVDPAGNTLFWVNMGGFNARKSELNGNNSQTIGNAGNLDCESISFDPVKKLVYYANPNVEGKLLRKNLTNNTNKQFATTKIRAIAVVK